ncbi:branched-chain amino acid ABC transporter permease (plasmid) [Natrinema zhouii]|uniref:branched-chain amino acid ABC transporter permease n=1 Tax=Natrinema zhouii TaxID=1710539 RepID=UPI001CFFAFF7|nr:branched-chain amino acid ABC transporter permease [Natrinema zhouii]UHQ98845.1 branched-chain amino acid ABC transporter permease [Natrinema zhouii]
MIVRTFDQGFVDTAGGVLLQSGFLNRMVEPIQNLITDVVALDPVLLQLLIFGVLLGGVYALAALGMTIIFGVMDVINFAHGAYMAVAMYVVWWVSSNAGISPFIAIPLATGVVFLLGMVTHVALIEPIIDREAQSHLLVTFAAALIIESVLQIVFQPDPRSLDISLGRSEVLGAGIPHIQLVALLLAVTAVVAVWLFLYRTRLGRAIRATADSREDAQFVGINVPRINSLTFGLGAGLAGLAGGAVALFRLFDPFVGTEQYLALAFVIVVLGGLGSLYGALAGGFIIGIVHNFSAFYMHGSSYDIVIMMIFIVVLLVKPEGLFGSEVTNE